MGKSEAEVTQRGAAEDSKIIVMFPVAKDFQSLRYFNICPPFLRWLCCPRTRVLPDTLPCSSPLGGEFGHKPTLLSWESSVGLLITRA